MTMAQRRAHSHAALHGSAQSGHTMVPVATTFRGTCRDLTLEEMTMFAHLRILALAIALALPLLAASQTAEGSKGDASPTQQAAREDGAGHVMFGWQLMTPEERSAQRAKMRAATSAEERERIRAEHHAKMLERARERGVTLPEQPPSRPAAVDPQR